MKGENNRNLVVKYLTHMLFFVGLFSAQMSSHVCTPAGDPADINFRNKKNGKTCQSGGTTSPCFIGLKLITQLHVAATSISGVVIYIFLTQFVSGHSGQ